MADNIRATPSTGSTGALFASDELTITGSTDIVQVPLTKLGFGAADAFTYASSSNPYPVFIYGSTALSVSGSTISVSGSSVTLNGVSSDAGLPVRIMGSTVLTVNVTNAVSVSGSTVSVSGSTISVSGSSVSLNGITSDAGLPVRIMSSTTLSVSGSTVSVSGSSVSLNGVTSNAGLPVFIYGSTVLSVSGSSVSLNGITSDAGLPVRIMGSTTLSVSGSTVSVSGSTISVSGSSVTLNGVTTDAGLPVRIMGSTALSVSGSTVSVSGSTVSVSGSTLSVSGSTVSVVNGSTFLVQPQAYASGGADPYSFLSSSAVNSTTIKSAAGQVYTVDFFNTSSTPAHGRLYNQTTTPASTDDANIKFRFTVPGSSAGAGFVKSWPLGLAFGTGIGIRVTGGQADTDTTVLSTGHLSGNVSFK